MTERVTVGNLRVAKVLYDFINNEALPGTGIDPDSFWAGADKVVTDLAPQNQDLLARRDELQAQIDTWHRQHGSSSRSTPTAYKQFLTEIGYLLPEPDDFTITTAGVDDEITTTAGPQLVVPILNARFALNAANARWGSLYDALYGTDAIPEDDGAEKGTRLQQGARRQGHRLRPPLPRRRRPAGVGRHGARPPASRSARTTASCSIDLGDGLSTGLATPEQFVGYTGELGSPTGRCCWSTTACTSRSRSTPTRPSARPTPAGIKDVVLESAITTIMDFEDSVAAVDADDKVLGYRNWLGLNKGDLAEEVTKGGKTFTRVLNPDRTYTAPDGGELTLPGRWLLFVRNVGHLMTNDAIVDADGNEIPEGIQDALFTSLIAMHGLKAGDEQRAAGQQPHRLDLHRQAEDARPRRGRVHRRAVRPRRGRARPAAEHPQGRHHGRGAAHHRQPQGLHQGRRRPRGVHQHRLPRPHRRRDPHLDGGRPDDPQGRDEDAAVDPGLRGQERRHRPGHRVSGRAQIGKGMWAMTDLMADMLEQKIGQPKAGANTAWVPSPTAATLHAMHYHQVDVYAVQKELAGQDAHHHRRAADHPAGQGAGWAAEEIREELDNNCQSILGYVVRWIDAGVGCSKVPDIHDVALMEDRATLRISSQLLANWLRHGVITEDDVKASLRRMAAVVDQQNADDPDYRPMAPDLDGQHRVPGREGTDPVRGAAAQRLHRADPAPPSPRVQGAPQPVTDFDGAVDTTSQEA